MKQKLLVKLKTQKFFHLTTKQTVLGKTEPTMGEVYSSQQEMASLAHPKLPNFKKMKKYGST